MKDKFQEGFPPFSGNQNKNYDGAKKAFEDAILGMDPSKTKDLKPEQDAAPQEKVPFYEHNIIKETVLPILQRLEESFGLTDENIEELLGPG